MNILVFLLVGLVAGWSAGRMIEGHGFGSLGDIIVGIIGAFVGGAVFSAFGLEAYGIWGAVVMSIVGAVLFLVLVGFLKSNTRIPRSRG